MAPEAGGDGAPLDRLVRGHVVHAQRPAAVADPFADLPRGLAPVERRRPLRREALECIRHVRVAEQVPLDQLLPLGRVEAGGLGRRGQDRVEDLVEVGGCRGHPHLPAELDPRFGEPAERHRSESTRDVFEAGRVARHAAGGRAAAEGLGRLVEVDRDRDELRAALDTVRRRRRRRSRRGCPPPPDGRA